MRPTNTLAALMCTALPLAPLQIAPGIYVRQGACAEPAANNQGGIANLAFVIGKESVAVIDPGGSLADGASLRKAIRATTSLPIRYVIMTHDHPDHTLGAEAFAADHPIYVGQADMPAALASRGAFDHTRLAGLVGEAEAGHVVTPTMLVRTTATLDLGGRTLTLRAFAPAHTATDLVVMDPTTATLFTGDLLFVGRVPALDGSIKGWLAALDTLTALKAARAVPGHGPAVVAWPEDAAPERTYLSVLLHDVRTAIAKGRDIDDAVAGAARSERDKWALFDLYNGHNATVAYKELQWE